MMNSHWLLVGSLAAVGVAAEGIHLLQHVRHKRHAQDLRARAIAAQACRPESNTIAPREKHGRRDVHADSHSSPHV